MITFAVDRCVVITVRLYINKIQQGLQRIFLALPNARHDQHFHIQSAEVFYVADQCFVSLNSAKGVLVAQRIAAGAFTYLRCAVKSTCTSPSGAVLNAGWNFDSFIHEQIIIGASMGSASENII
jgi:hypothetical protein